MNTQLKLALFAAALFTLTPHMGLGTGNAIQSSCAGNFTKCKGGTQTATGGTTDVGIGLNAVGDKATFNTAGIKVNNAFGKLTAAKTKTLSMPNPNNNLKNSAKLYSLTPTLGSRLIKNKEQQLLFVAFDLTKELPSWAPAYVRTELAKVKSAEPNAKAAVYVYQHIAGEPATQWTELGKAAFSTTNLATESVDATVTPDAKISVKSEVADIEGTLGTSR